MIKCAVLSLLVMSPLMLLARRAPTGFLDRTVSVDDVTYRYQVYLPFGWTKDRSWPVILVLHGAGERGDDGLAQTQVGIGTAIRQHDDRWPFIIVMPQCRKDTWWTDPKMEAQALAALDRSIKEFHGDRDRVVLTGLSMGGYGTWDLAARYPERWAALAPICGGIEPPKPDVKDIEVELAKENVADPYAATAQKIGKLPVWVFHGGADPTVPPEESRKMVAALKADGGNVQYSEFPGVGHNSWDEAYAEEQLPRWMLEQKR